MPNQNKFKILRKRAETLLTNCDEYILEMSDQDILELIHELETHQIELELQNQELITSQSELEMTKLAEIPKIISGLDFMPNVS